MTPKPLGRRPGGESSRAAIVAAARREFAHRGFDRATIRSIASAADVDPATIYHFFAGKDDLLAAALEFPVGDDVIRTVLPVDREVVAGELLTTVLTRWQQPEIADRLMALIRVAATHPDAATAVGSLLDASVLRPLVSGIRADDAELRAGLVATQLAGLAVLRIVVPFGPIADAPIDELVAVVAPTIDRYLTGDLTDDSG
jgi:AcrR family transcriptional regulator